MLFSGKWFDPVIGIDIHLIQPPGPVPPIPVPHPFIGIVYDPMGLAVGMAIGAAMSGIFGGPFKGPVLINGMPAANTGMRVKGMPVHVPIGGVFVNPPKNEGTIITGSKTVHVLGASGARLTSSVITCNDPVNLPTSVVMSIPMGPPVFTGGPTAVDWFAAVLAAIRTKWVSDKLHEILGAESGSWTSKLICFFTGHPVDVATGRVLTDQIDFALRGPIPFRFERIYYSASTYKGPLGHGWHHSYDQHIDLRDGRIFLRAEDGREIEFDFIEVGESMYEETERLELRRYESFLILRTADRRRLHFGPAKRRNGSFPLTRIEDLLGNTVTLEYERDNLVRITDNRARALTLVYDAEERLQTVLATHPSGQPRLSAVVRFEYDDAGDLVTAYDALGNPWRYAYKNHLLVKETNRNGLSFYFEYDEYTPDGWCVHTWGDGGIYDHKLRYYKAAHITIVENSLGAKRTYLWNDAGLVTTIVDALGGHTRFEWDNARRKIAEINPAGGVTRFKYDAQGNLTGVVKPDGMALKLAYDNLNNPVRMVDPNGAEWTWKYDCCGRLIERTDALGQRTTYRYNGKSSCEIIGPSRNSTWVGYDERGAVSWLRTADGAESKWVRDFFGRITQVIDLRKNIQHREYDALGRVCRVEEPDGQIRELAYDAEGNLTLARDFQHDVRFTYKGIRRMASRQEGGTTLKFDYDLEGHLTRIINESGQLYAFEYDAEGRIVTETGYDGLRREYTRDETGRVIRVRLPGGKTAQYSYDEVGRIVMILDPDGRQRRFKYRADGHLLEASTDSVLVKFERDALGRVLREWQNDEWISSVYNHVGLRISLASSLGLKQTIERGALGHFEASKVSVGQDPLWETHTKHDVLGMELDSLFPGAVSSTWKRDTLGRPIHRNVLAGHTAHIQTSYEWEVDNRLAKVVDYTLETTSYSYDSLGNLAFARHSSGTIDFRTPDAVGNLFRTADRSDRKYGPAGQLLEAGGTTYRYDDEGNLVEKARAEGGIWRFFWYGSGMLKAVELPCGQLVEFEYDALGRRVSKKFQDKKVRYLWDGDNPLHEWIVNQESRRSQDKRSRDGNGEWTNSPTQRLREGVITWAFKPESFSPIAKLSGRRAWSVLTDQLGTPVAMFDDEGNRVWMAKLNVYGEIVTHQGALDACPFRFPGQYRDEETGLHYNRFRYYDPEGGTYISQDPIRIKRGGAPYAYVPDPLGWVDPFGLHSIFAWLETDGGKVPIPGPGPYGGWPNTGGSSGNASDMFGRIGDSEWHLLQALEGDARLEGSTLVIASMGQEVRGGVRSLSPMDPCCDCAEALEAFAERNGCTVRYHGEGEQPFVYSCE
jgi:RHS repeat-associated protein